MPAVDRLSTLHDELLHHILSFFPDTKSRAATSILSRRWRHLWAHHPDIRLAMGYGEDLAAVASSYVAVVDACFASMNRSFDATSTSPPPPIHRLDLCLWLPISSCSPVQSRANVKTVDRWVSQARCRNVRELKLWVRNYRADWYSRIPCSLFSCHSVAELDISSAEFPRIPSNFRGFPVLKKLNINFGAIQSDELADLLVGCPMLETLFVSGCYGVDNVNISSEKLPKLSYLLLVDRYEDGHMTVELEAAGLTVFHFQGDLSRLSWSGPLYLQKVNVKSNNKKKFHCKEQWMSIVRAVSNATVLIVDYLFYQFEIPKNYVSGVYSPAFKNLKKLECHIDWVTCSALHCLTSNLGQCSSLEKLRICLGRDARSDVKTELLKSHGEEFHDSSKILKYKNEFLNLVEENYENDESDQFKNLDEVGNVLPKLKSFTVTQFLGTSNEMQLVRFVLGNAMILENFMLLDFLCREELEIYLLLNPLPRASDQVQLKLNQVTNFFDEVYLFGKSYIFEHGAS